jgi:phosphohistidine phosphatase
MDVYFLRHASAGQHMADPHKDEARPLDDKGEEQSRNMGAALAALGLEVDAVISSPLLRALQTAKLVARELGFREEIQSHDSLRPSADYAAFHRMLHQLKHDAVIVAGHNPSLSEFLARSVGRGAAVPSIDLKKGAVAKVRLDTDGAALEWLLTPKLARALQSKPATKSRPKTSRK